MIRPAGRGSAFHSIQQSALYIGSDELVQPELAAEVVIERASSHLGRCRQFADCDLIKGACSEGSHRREDESALRGRRHRNPLAHGTIILLRYKEILL